LISDYARVNYSFKDKYLFQDRYAGTEAPCLAPIINGGFPGSQRGLADQQGRVHERPDTIDDLKIRGGYGVVGNAFGFGAYTAQTFSGLLGTFYSNGSQVNAMDRCRQPTPICAGNRRLLRTSGVDFSMLRGRLSGSVDVYNKTTTDMILNYQADPFAIYSKGIVANGGGVNNKGIELSLTATPVISGDFSWTTTLNASHNVNKITSLNNPCSPR